MCEYHGYTNLKVFEEMINDSNNRNKPIIVYFNDYDPGISENIKIEKKIAKLVDKCEKPINYAIVNAEKNKDIMKKYDIESYPLFLVFLNKRIILYIAGDKDISNFLTSDNILNLDNIDRLRVLQGKYLANLFKSYNSNSMLEKALNLYTYSQENLDNSLLKVSKMGDFEIGNEDTLKRIKMLLNKGADIHTENEKVLSNAIKSAKTMNEDDDIFIMVKFLLKNGADINKIRDRLSENTIRNISGSLLKRSVRRKKLENIIKEIEPIYYSPGYKGSILAERRFQKAVKQEKELLKRKEDKKRIKPLDED